MGAIRLEDAKLIAEYMEYLLHNEYGKIGHLYGKDNRQELLDFVRKTVCQPSFAGVPELDPDKEGKGYCIYQNNPPPGKDLSVKLGHVENGSTVEDRLAKMKTDNPDVEDASILCETTGTYSLERSVHGLFSEYRRSSKNEWFDFTLNDLYREREKFDRNSKILAHRTARFFIDAMLSKLNS